ncbi:filamentous hemagglutinin N-terminal domain-containing protein [Methylocapsa acidiphila]|uniref:two-partner secretion domain-containing protein n=1 Tax=Methylocapsa acidiphila TaxID=133552 RepID=UPI00041DB448|nr:filamentous hemagglutinin N-terminal domain-containing protein [Methylocapsa acidiphila]
MQYLNSQIDSLLRLPLPDATPSLPTASINLRGLHGVLLTTTAVAALLALQDAALAGPTGGTVVEGSANISQSGSTTNINQSSSKAIINWQGFSIGSQETVNFNQPSSSSVTLNRVIGNEQSIISGALNANGQVFIINSAGVLFTKDSQVNVGGLVASTLDISNKNFMAGNYVFSGSSSASVVNMGTIHAADGGYVALLGQTVSNQGVITATLGTVAMASGNKIALNFNGDSLVDVTIDEGTLNALVENKGAIKADGGRVVLTAKAADAVLSAQVNNSGVIQAQTMAALKGGSGASATAHVGSIKLLASGGTVKVAGKLDASAPKGGNGGKIETSGNRVTIADDAVITTKSASGDNGTWLIDPDGFNIGGPQADISGTLLSSLLGFNNITLQSTDGHGVDGNINVNAPVTWSANTTLTLDATNNININAPITATGLSAGLVLNYGGYATTGSVKAGTDYYINNITTNSDGSVQVSPASITLSGDNASLSINGQAYTLIHTMAQLEAISTPVLDANGNQVYSDWDGTPVYTAATGYYALAENLDASGKTYSGSVINTLSGTLAGLGHKVSNLTITDTKGYGNDGLIGQVGSIATDGTVSSTGTVRDIGLVNATITDDTGVGRGGGADGALAGVNNQGSSISNVYAINAIMTGVFQVGGLVGRNQGAIDNAHTVTTISALDAGSDYGGLVGFNLGTIDNSSAKAKITSAGVLSDGGSSLTFSTNIGGLVGYNAGSINNSHAFVDITATNGWEVGGLVGYNASGFDSTSRPGKITGSSAVGTVNATWTYTQVNGQNYGGLVGENSGGSIIDSASNVNLTVTATNGSFVQNIGGLVGSNSSNIFDGTGGAITNSTSYGNVSTSGLAFEVGGLVGLNFDGTFNGDHAFGNVNGTVDVGGLVGSNEIGSISDSTASGTVTGKANVNGLVGSNGGTVANSTYQNAAAAAAAAAAQQLAQEAATATAAANVISTTNAEMTAATPPSGSQSTAGKEKVAAIAGPKIDDNLTIKEPPPSSGAAGGGRANRGGDSEAAAGEEENAASEAPRARHHVSSRSTTRKAVVKVKGAGFGATIRHIEIDGERYNLEDSSSKNGGSAPEKAQ